jgi:hypothetical protein
MPVRFGAIQWPSWSGQARSTTQWYSNNQLSPAGYQTRAPWFAQQLSAQTLYINATQAHTDQDIIYARDGGIKYWAYVWYGNNPQDGTSSLQSEWNQYQASPNKLLVNWCLIPAVASTFVTDVTANIMRYIGYFQQPNYEKVLTNRPLIYLLGGNVSGMAGAITSLRTACSANGVGDPYIVVMEFDPTQASNDATAIGANAITTYARAYGGASQKTFASYIDDQQSQWENYWRPTGRQLVPNVTSGWNISPIRARGFPGTSYSRGGTDANQYDMVVPATPAELVTLATRCKTFIADNAAQCPANTAIWYAWSEHTEGGYIRPLWSSTGPNKTRLDALVTVHNS